MEDLGLSLNPKPEDWILPGRNRTACFLQYKLHQLKKKKKIPVIVGPETTKIHVFLCLAMHLLVIHASNRLILWHTKTAAVGSVKGDRGCVLLLRG